ncbi:MAG: CDP-alcohol phosphatidyltransferase family protein [Caldimicrobium sp.]|nr:CDP-alcohol phosphatidyltransferase family protein [Caldimicrobium sp.]MCX7873153.1 CDP-alcohol phosphatidyltransferase family protein [Caldimicrobium sp.]MDW8094269.1 CDP-alcohol phosphatidyltransferase family protein [Caldimicrobium sp.]
MSLLSLVRLPLALFFIYYLYCRNLGLALFCLLLAGLSDKLDGTLARRLGMGNNLLGRILDPVADRIFMFLSFSALYFVDLKIEVSSWIILITVGQDIVLAPLGAYVFVKKKKALGSALGKFVTFYQYLFLIIVLSVNVWNFNIGDVNIYLLLLEMLLVLFNLSSAVHHVLLWLHELRN